MIKEMASSPPVDVAVKGVGRAGVGAKVTKRFLILSLGDCPCSPALPQFLLAKPGRTGLCARAGSASAMLVTLPCSPHPAARFANSWSPCLVLHP